jgi:hypothetical protein
MKKKYFILLFFLVSIIGCSRYKDHSCTCYPNTNSICGLGEVSNTNIRAKSEVEASQECESK